MAIDIVLLSSNDDALSLRQILGAHGLAVTVHHLLDLPSLRELIPSLGLKSRLISYLSPVIVPADCLAAFSLGAYNFHPGSPDYPGTAPEAWACFERAKTFGATLHVMAPQVDAGEIIDCELLPVTSAKDRPGYGNVARQALALLFSRTAPALTREAPLSATSRRAWGGQRRTADDFTKMCQLSADMSREDLEHRLNSFGPPGPVEFSLTLHGLRFVMEAPGGVLGHLDPPQPERILGWVRDANAPSVRQEVKLVVDGRDYLLTADEFRPDVCEAGFGDGHSGFSWSVPGHLRDGRPHRVEAYCKGQPVPGSPKLAVFPRPPQDAPQA
ncbi:formyltransferase family protein [Solidesulfovibrio sp.]|uniref:formyltransferase family protein n=1 Tax=Solidesulfovibrio sp. TaxID=2910990 RepID=UPI002B218488|nr:formyltransferase family protein [Solidesulfovibrio sp.]MEA4855226.1 formyltransferase family protein [Solidesulfovibrio sp.]